MWHTCRSSQTLYADHIHCCKSLYISYFTVMIIVYGRIIIEINMRVLVFGEKTQTLQWFSQQSFFGIQNIQTDRTIAYLTERKSFRRTKWLNTNYWWSNIHWTIQLSFGQLNHVSNTNGSLSLSLSPLSVCVIFFFVLHTNESIPFLS